MSVHVVVCVCVCVEKDLLFEWTQIQNDEQRIPAGME
jgi:hypothetical protein